MVIKFLKNGLCLPSGLFAVREGRGHHEDRGNTREGQVLGQQFGDRSALEVDRPHYLDEISRRDGIGQALRPPGHRTDGGEEAAHQLKEVNMLLS